MADAPLTWDELRPLMIAVMEADNTGGHLRGTSNWAAAIAKAVVAAQPQPQPAQPLTETQVVALLCELNGAIYESASPTEMFSVIVRAVERLHGITAPSTPTPPEVAP